MNLCSCSWFGIKPIYLTLELIIVIIALSGCNSLNPITEAIPTFVVPEPSIETRPTDTAQIKNLTPVTSTSPSPIDTSVTPLPPDHPTLDFRVYFPSVPAGLGKEYKHLIFFSNQSGVYLLYQINLDGSGLTQLSKETDKNVYDMEPAWSPDGRIAFTSDHVDTFWQVFVLQPDHPIPIQLTNWNGQSWSLSWSPDRKSIAFVSDITGDQEIYIIPAEGGTPVNLTQYPGSNDYLPVWSPDGQQMMFVSDREEGGENLDIYVMNIDGSDVTRLTTSKEWDTSPSWSPDGSKIAFVSDREGNFDVYVMNYPDGIEANGGIPERLTKTAEYEWSPVWSPDGKFIAFTSLRDKIDEKYQVYTMASDGSNQTRITSDTSDNIIPRWWP